MRLTCLLVVLPLTAFSLAGCAERAGRPSDDRPQINPATVGPSPHSLPRNPAIMR